MPLTIDEILQCEERLQAEIAERECFLAALTVLKGYAEKGKSLLGVELGAFGKALLSNNRDTLLLNPAPKPAAEVPPAPAAPELPPPERYVHPELKAMGHLGVGAKIAWAARHMTGDFTVKDILALLRREGSGAFVEQASVVLSRMKRRGQLIEKVRGSGRRPTVFANPEAALEAEAA